MVKEIKTLQEFDALIKENKKVAVDFTATWCGPCRSIGPKFEAMDPNYPEIVFVKVDVDANSDTAGKYDISAMPTFKMFFNGEEMKDIMVVGASEQKLKESIEKLKAM